MDRQLIVSDTVHIDVAPQTAYGAVSDVTQMGRWSPENKGARHGSQTPMSVGASFVGRNTRGRWRWSTECTVTAADPGERFAFRVHRIGLRAPVLSSRIATWEYRFESAGDGTRVTETWTDDRPWPDAAAKVFDAIVTGGRTFAAFQKRNIRRTLDNLKRELEAA